MTGDHKELPSDEARARITVPRPLSFLPILTVLLLIGVVVGFLIR